jgi:hypothetical protein
MLQELSSRSTPVADLHELPYSLKDGSIGHSIQYGFALAQQLIHFGAVPGESCMESS